MGRKKRKQKEKQAYVKKKQHTVRQGLGAQAEDPESKLFHAEQIRTEKHSHGQPDSADEKEHA